MILWEIERMYGLRRVQPKRLYESVVEQFLALIAEGKIELGERLPTERELEERLGVSRGVLREAFRVLEARGLIESRQGGGRFLRALPHGVDSVSLSPDLQLEQAAFLDYWEVREALEARAARLAAAKANDQERNDLVQMARNLIALPANSGERERADMEFHRTIARLSKNLLLMRLLNDLLDVAVGMRERLVERLVGERTDGDYPVDNLEIAMAIQAGNEDEAATLVLRHLRIARRKYTATEPPAREIGG